MSTDIRALTAVAVSAVSTVADPGTETHGDSSPVSVEHSGPDPHPVVKAALNAQHYEWYPEELTHPNPAVRADAHIRLLEASRVTAAVLRCAADQFDNAEYADLAAAEMLRDLADAIDPKENNQ